MRFIPEHRGYVCCIIEGNITYETLKSKGKVLINYNNSAAEKVGPECPTKIVGVPDQWTWGENGRGQMYLGQKRNFSVSSICLHVYTAGIAIRSRKLRKGLGSPNRLSKLIQALKLTILTTKVRTLEE